LRNIPVLRGLLPQIDDLPFAPFVREFLDFFARDIARPLAALPHQFVHNDFNARNLIVDERDDARISGVIDFGDAAYTARIVDVAVAVIGQLSAPDTADLALETFIEAYRAVSPLEAREEALLPCLVAARIVQNVVMTSWYRSRQPVDGHFAAFDAEYFAWRVDFARRLTARYARAIGTVFNA
jgi:hydroxylysine kinase